MNRFRVKSPWCEHNSESASWRKTLGRSGWDRLSWAASRACRTWRALCNTPTNGELEISRSWKPPELPEILNERDSKEAFWGFPVNAMDHWSKTQVYRRSWWEGWKKKKLLGNCRGWLDLLQKKIRGYSKSPFVQLLCCFLVQLFSPNTILAGETAGKFLSSSYITFKFISQPADMNDWSARQEIITLDIQYSAGLHGGSST